MVMHDEDCQLPSLDWLTDSVKHQSSTLHLPDPVAFNFSLYKKRSKTNNHCQNNAPKDVDFAKEAIKPPYSYAELITLAMRHHGQRKVLLSDIYEYVRKNFAWYRKTDVTWQNSIRHNLSLNKQFIKLPRKKGEKGKGSYWMLDHNATESNGLKMKKNGITTNGKMRILEKSCKPSLNPAVLSYLKKQNEPKKQLIVNNLRSTNFSNNPLDITEKNVKEALHPENIEITSTMDENASLHLSSVSSPTIRNFTQHENEQELLEATDVENDNNKSPVWWKNDENSTFLNSLDFGQPSLPRFSDAFANGGFECSNAESEEYLWPEVDLQVADQCLFFDLSI